MVAGEGMDIRRQIKAIPNNKNIMEVIEEVEAPCRHGEAVEEDRCKDRQLHLMELEADMIREVVVKAEDTLRMAVLQGEVEDLLRWSDLLPRTPAVSTFGREYA